MPQKVIVLVSGGMDSVVALYHAHKQYEVVAGLSFNYGSKHNHQEIPCAAWHCDRLRIRHRVVTLDFMENLFKSSLLRGGAKIPNGHYEEKTMQQTVVPFRNGILLAIAGGYADSIGAQGVVIAAHAGDHTIYPDCRKEFMDAMNEALKLGTYGHIQVLGQFVNLTKSWFVSRGHELGVDFTKTWSCYKGDAIHCGVCGTCVERREAFIQAKVDDPTVYASTDPIPPKP